jgi:hypothetical protein
MKSLHEQLNDYLIDSYGIKLTESCIKDIFNECLSLHQQNKCNDQMEISQQEFDLMIMGCFRYALGRMSYMVSDTVDFIISKWDYISLDRQEMIVREISHSIQNGTAGHECDVAQWKRILELNK